MMQASHVQNRSALMDFGVSPVGWGNDLSETDHNCKLQLFESIH
jgi:hypothetical protein